MLDVFVGAVTPNEKY